MEYVDASTLRKLSTSGDIIIVDASWASANDVERARAAHESERIPNATFYDHDEVCDLSSPLPQAFPAAGGVRARRRRRTRGDEDARRGDIREKRRVVRGGGVCVRVLGIWTSRTGDGAQGRDGGVEGGRLRDGGRGGDDARAGDGGVRRRRIERNARGGRNRDSSTRKIC